MLVRFLPVLVQKVFVMKMIVSNKDRKKTQNQTGGENTRFNDHRHRPEIRDNLDSREMEEQIFKGDDTTHNRKSHHNKGRKTGR